MPSSGSGTGTPISSGTGVGIAPTKAYFPSLPLDTFRRIMGFHPFHFWGLANSTVPITSACNSWVSQYAWQNVDAAGRAEIMEAIETAEHRIRDHLGYYPAPRYVEDTVPWPKYFDNNQWRYGETDADGHRIGVRLPSGYVQAIGVETLTSLGDAAITASDADGDGVNDTFTATLPTVITDASQIAVYYTTADRLDSEAVGDRWRIQPVSVTISGGTVTIRGRYWLLVKPVLYEGAALTQIDPGDANNFVSQISIYQRSTYTEGETVSNSQAVLLWETDPCHSWFCVCSSCTGISYTPASSSNDPAAVGKAVARAGIRDAVNGLVVPAQSVRNSTTGIWSSVDWNGYREPDRVTVRYLAGLPLESDGQMSSAWQTIVARLAAAELGRRICACDFSNQEMYHWQFDLARDGGANDERYQINFDDLRNPLGTRRGHLYAWRQIRNLQVLQGLTY